MSGEAGDVPGLDPAINPVPPPRSRWGRRSPAPVDEAFGTDRGGPTYAALDLGTNNCRLLIATPQGGGFRVVEAYSRIVRLGEGLGQSGRLGDSAMERALGALKVSAEKMALAIPDCPDVNM